eukprot:2281586-Pyramimonas_sp.AAC.1
MALGPTFLAKTLTTHGGLGYYTTTPAGPATTPAPTPTTHPPATAHSTPASTTPTPLQQPDADHHEPLGGGAMDRPD